MVPSSSQPPSPCDRWRDSREIWVRKLPVSDLHLPWEIPSRSEPTSSVWSWPGCCLQLLLHTDSATAQPNSIHLPQELGAAPARRSSHSNWHAHQMMMPRARVFAPWIQHPASLCLISRCSGNSRKTSKLIDKLQHRSSRVVLHRKASYLRWRFLLLLLHPKEEDRTLDWIKLANSRSCNGREKNRIRDAQKFAGEWRNFQLLVAGGRECALELEEMRTFFLMRALFFCPCACAPGGGVGRKKGDRSGAQQLSESSRVFGFFPKSSSSSLFHQRQTLNLRDR